MLPKAFSCFVAASLFYYPINKIYHNKIFTAKELSKTYLNTVKNAEVNCANDVSLFCNDRHTYQSPELDFFMLMFGDGLFPSPDPVMGLFSYQTSFSVYIDSEENAVTMIVPISPIHIVLEYEVGSRRLTSNSMTRDEHALEESPTIDFGFGAKVDKCLQDIRQGINPFDMVSPPPILSQSCDATLDTLVENYVEFGGQLDQIKWICGALLTVLVSLFLLFLSMLFFSDEEDSDDDEEMISDEYYYVPLEDHDFHNVHERTYTGIPLQVI